jgi:hypothetical protein
MPANFLPISFDILRSSGFDFLSSVDGDTAADDWATPLWILSSDFAFETDFPLALLCFLFRFLSGSVINLGTVLSLCAASVDCDVLWGTPHLSTFRTTALPLLPLCRAN